MHDSHRRRRLKTETERETSEDEAKSLCNSSIIKIQRFNYANYLNKGVCVVTIYSSSVKT